MVTSCDGRMTEEFGIFCFSNFTEFFHGSEGFFRLLKFKVLDLLAMISSKCS